MSDQTPADKSLKDLQTAVPPPAALEDRVVASLHSQGLLAAPQHSRLRPLLTAAACLLTLGLGFMMGSAAVPEQDPDFSITNHVAQTQPDKQVYALLMYETEKFRSPQSIIESQEEYTAYSKWVSQAYAQEMFITGEAFDMQTGWLLDGDGVIAGVNQPGGQGALSGMFFLRADNLEQALELARALPHLQQGGQVVVMATQRTDLPPA